jgi:hypothetical protein
MRHDLANLAFVNVFFVDYFSLIGLISFFSEHKQNVKFERRHDKFKFVEKYLWNSHLFEFIKNYLNYI